MEKERSRNVAILSLSMIAVTVVILRAMGRVWWCSCGSFVPWSWDIWTLHNSQHLLDPYSFTHVLHGVILFAALQLLPARVTPPWRFLVAIAIESGWEILENSPIIIERYRAVTISLDYYGDSIANSISDILACVIGYLAASRMRWWGWLVTIVVIELLLLLTIRDNLALNVLMLMWPIEAIKEWQS